MTTLRYRAFKNPPTWHSNAPLAEFDFSLDKLILVLQKEVAWYRNHPALLEYEANRHNCSRLEAVIERFQSTVAAGQSTVWESSEEDDLIWWHVGRLVFAQDFATVRCLACDCRYAPDQCRAEEWSIGESLFAEGGTQLFCPAEHLLYKWRTWNS